jgi:hypothetical protein
MRSALAWRTSAEPSPALRLRLPTRLPHLLALRTGLRGGGMPAIQRLEFGVRALTPLEQAPGVGRSIRDAGEPWAFRRRGARHRFHYRAGAQKCSRRKWGNQDQEALGRSEDFGKFLRVPESGSSEAAFANNEKAASFKGTGFLLCSDRHSVAKPAKNICISTPNIFAF